MVLSEELSDEEIARAIQNGKIDQYKIILDRYQAKIIRYTRKFIYNEHDLDDAVQEIFIRAYENIQSYNSKKKFSPWVFRLAHNHIVNILRKRKFWISVDWDTFFPHKISRENPANDYANREQKTLVEKSLKQLPTKYREPIYLKVFEELSLSEIADILQIPIGTVGVRIYRAKMLLKTILTDNGYKKNY
ncbi:MAG: sigma-70 family RNA polymerase sigma factor [Patescibacteria group bacterium]